MGVGYVLPVCTLSSRLISSVAAQNSMKNGKFSIICFCLLQLAVKTHSLAAVVSIFALHPSCALCVNEGSGRTVGPSRAANLMSSL